MEMQVLFYELAIMISLDLYILQYNVLQYLGKVALALESLTAPTLYNIMSNVMYCVLYLLVEQAKLLYTSLSRELCNKGIYEFLFLGAGRSDSKQFAGIF